MGPCCSLCRALVGCEKVLYFSQPFAYIELVAGRGPAAAELTPMFTLETFPRFRAAVAALAHHHGLALARGPALPDSAYDAVEAAEAELIGLSDDDVAALLESLDGFAFQRSDLENSVPSAAYLLAGLSDGSLGSRVFVD